MASIRSRLIKQLVKHRIGRTLRAEVPVEQQRKELEQLSLISVVSPTTKIREVLAPNCPAEWVTHRNARSSHAILFCRFVVLSLKTNLVEGCCRNATRLVQHECDACLLHARRHRRGQRTCCRGYWTLGLGHLA